MHHHPTTAIKCADQGTMERQLFFKRNFFLERVINEIRIKRGKRCQKKRQKWKERLFWALGGGDVKGGF